MEANPSPGPRSGFVGAWDRLVGPGASTVENGAILSTAVVGTAVTALLARDTSRWGRLALTVLGLDLWGGLVANSTPTCVRWYERPGQGTREHVAFAVAHLHPFVIAFLDRGAIRDSGAANRLGWASSQYLWMLGSTITMVRAPRRWPRRLGLTTTVAGIAIDRILGPSPNAPWFAPVYHGKLLAGHAGGGALPIDVDEQN